MSMTDPIADLLTRIRNGQTAGKSEVQLASSRLKTAIVKVLKDEGYISDFRLDAEGGKPRLTVTLPTEAAATALAVAEYVLSAGC